MGRSIGLLEISGVTAAVDALDIMLKTADVELVTWERKLGGRLVTVIVTGEVSAVTQAVETAAARAIKAPVSYAVIANPHGEVERLLALSASRLTKKAKGADADVCNREVNERAAKPAAKKPPQRRTPKKSSEN